MLLIFFFYLISPFLLAKVVVVRWFSINNGKEWEWM